MNALDSIRSIRDMDLRGKIVFMRLDFNVPLSTPDLNTGERSIEEDARITEALPTIRLALEKGAKLVLASHLGRPDGEEKPEFSLEPVGRKLSTLLGMEVTLADDCIGEGIELRAKSLKDGEILLLENLRFHPGEEKNDPAFVRDLSRIGQIYITDAFGTAHREHASTYGVPQVSPMKGIGLLIEKELKFLDPLLTGAKKPFYAILGGSKVTDKIATIDSLLSRIDALLIGGAMAHAFWKAQGKEIPTGAKQPKSDDVEAARRVLKDAAKREIPVITPEDTVEGFDIGPKTVKKFVDVLGRAKTVFWNGPLGWFEKPEYAAGTFEVAKALAAMASVKIVGGGDTVSAIKKSGVADRFDHLSTGGGAVLEYLEGKGLPGIEILKLSGRDRHLFQEGKGVRTDLQFEDESNE